MAVKTEDLTRPVLQAIESWTSVQNHELGYETTELSTGRRFQYKRLGAAVTGPGVCTAGTPVGGYIASANATHTAHYVSADASLAQCVPVGVVHGLATAANCYGFVEMADLGLITTANVTLAGVLAGDLLQWASDGFLSVLDGASAASTTLGASVVAFAVDSHLASYSRGSVLLTTVNSVTPIAVHWR
ncbi:MAG TPA: hypothetical protein VM243_02200 [Phycisphaerae bacterium]|nr:hypothetical protein [Phycisphaerae bacterium]